MNTDIVIVGSLNMDMVVRVNRRPSRGETVLGNDFFTSPGGKGANQAFAARKLGASVSMIGKVGADPFGDQLLRNLEHIGVEIASIEPMPQHSTGIAMISVDPEGDNSIIVAPGANQWFTPMDVRHDEDLIKHAKLLMVQLEIPLETVMEAVKLAKQYNVPVLLDPAPAQLLSDELLAMVDYIVPNESEIAELTGIDVSDVESAIVAAKELLRKGVATVFAKLGDKGVVVVNANRTHFIEAFKVISVDSTAAGDAFAGAVGAALVSGKDVWQAAEFASVIGAMTVTKPGAQSSMPDLKEAELFIKQTAHDKVYPN